MLEKTAQKVERIKVGLGFDFLYETLLHKTAEVIADNKEREIHDSAIEFGVTKWMEGKK